MFVKRFQMAIFSLCFEFLKRERLFLGPIEYKPISSHVKMKKLVTRVTFIWEVPREIGSDG